MQRAGNNKRNENYPFKLASNPIKGDEDLMKDNEFLMKEELKKFTFRDTVN